MKTLATCDPVEFLVQTNKIRRSVEKWLTLTQIIQIRKRLPVLPEDAENRKEAMDEQVKKNLTAILDAVLEDHPVETAELLGLLCFVDPEDLKNHKMTEFMAAFSELVNSPEVVGFFTSLMQLGQMGIFDLSEISE